jgi:hypothetical protein
MAGHADSSGVTVDGNSALRTGARLGTAALLLAVAVGAVAAPTPPARADATAYVVNVTVRPGYHFADADHALAYGRRICDGVAAGTSYSETMNAIKSDFANPDDYQASYLIIQAVNELCPAQIWRLRQSAAGYRPPP